MEERKILYFQNKTIVMLVETGEPTKIVFEFKASKDGDLVATGILEVTCIDRNWKRREIPEVIKSLISR